MKFVTEVYLHLLFYILPIRNQITSIDTSGIDFILNLSDNNTESLLDFKRFSDLNCCTTKACANDHQNNDSFVFELLIKEKKPTLHNELIDGRCNTTATPKSITEFFGGEVKCIQEKIKNFENGTENNVTCNCIWWISDLKRCFANQTEHLLYPINTIESTTEIITVNAGDSLKLNATVTSDIFPANVTWYHKIEQLANGEKVAPVNVKKSEIITTSYDDSQTNCLRLGHVTLNDSGRYDIIVTTLDHKPIFHQTFNLKVLSKDVYNMQILAIEKTTKPIVDMRFLQANSTYDVMCKVDAYPFPLISMLQISCDSYGCKETGEIFDNVSDIQHGTIESAITWPVSALQSGFIKCSSHFNQSSSSAKFIQQEFVVTDVHESIRNNGVHFNITEPYDQKIIEDETIVLTLQIQKQYSAVTCKRCVKAELNCTTLFKAVATDYGTHPLNFSNNWVVVYEDTYLFKAGINTSSELSNKILLTAKNAKSTKHNGSYRCIVMNENMVINSNPLEFSIMQPLKPKIKTIQKLIVDTDKNNYNDELDKYEFQPNDNISVVCNVEGVPEPVVHWIYNYTVISTNHQLQIDNFMPDINEGNYCCQAINKVGNDTSCIHIKKGKPLYNKEEFQLDTLSKLIFVIMTATTVVLLTVTPMSFQRRTARRMELEDLNRDFQFHLNYERTRMLNQNGTNNGNQIKYDHEDQIVYDAEKEISRENFKLLDEIGCGIQSKVYKAELMHEDKRKIVAVKAVKESKNVEQLKGLLNDMGFLLMTGKHQNVLRFIGACTSNLADGDLYVIVEYCEFGSLDNYLFNAKGSFENCLLVNNDNLDFNDFDSVSGESSEYFHGDMPRVSTKDLMSYAYQVAVGMNYLSSKGIVHRDLALRNLLLNKRGVVKISDFGISRMENYYSQKVKSALPYKWMALETMVQPRKFTTKSDVWSYGILLWEIFSLADEPYTNMSVDNSFYNWLRNGNRMQCATYAPEPMYALMKECWQSKPDDRPNFADMQKTIQNIYEELFHDSLTLLEVETESCPVEAYVAPENIINVISLPIPIFGTAYHKAVGDYTTAEAFHRAVSCVTSVDSGFNDNSPSPNNSFSKSFENLAYMQSLSPQNLAKEITPL